MTLLMLSEQVERTTAFVIVYSEEWIPVVDVLKRL